jgi:hypothetical protein
VGKKTIAEDHKKEEVVKGRLLVYEGNDRRRDKDATGLIVDNHGDDQKDDKMVSTIQERPLGDAVSILQSSIRQLENDELGCVR